MKQNECINVCKAILQMLAAILIKNKTCTALPIWRRLWPACCTFSDIRDAFSISSSSKVAWERFQPRQVWSVHWTERPDCYGEQLQSLCTWKTRLAAMSRALHEESCYPQKNSTFCLRGIFLPRGTDLQARRLGASHLVRKHNGERLLWTTAPRRQCCSTPPSKRRFQLEGLWKMFLSLPISYHKTLENFPRVFPHKHFFAKLDRVHHSFLLLNESSHFEQIKQFKNLPSPTLEVLQLLGTQLLLFHF